MKEIYSSLLRTKSAKSSHNDVQVERNVISRLRKLFMLLGCRTVWTASLAFLASLSVGISSATTLVNGANQTGTILTATTNSYTFTAVKGDNINLRVGTTNFEGRLQLFGPDGTLLASAGGTTDVNISNYAATNSGAFTVLVSSWFAGGAGTYALHLAQFPEPFVVPAGDEGGPLTNGADATGTITLGDLDMWTFTASKGDNINLRVGTTNFEGRLQLFGPDGTLLASAGGATDVNISNYAATNSGTFTVLVSSWFASDTGTYALHLAQFPEPFVVPPGDEGGPLTNGADATGTITLGDLDMWTFTASKGDNINLRVGTTNFEGRLQLFGPDGTLLASAGGATDVNISNYAATNSGTFTVLVSSWFASDTGTYALHLAQFPEPFVVPAGDEGGPLTNGANATGTITLGDLDMWTFTASKGDNINLRVGTTNFEGRLQLFGPDGALLASAGGTTDVNISNYAATNSGAFTVLVSSWFASDTGTYALHLAQFPEPFIVPPGDEGGPLTNGADATGTITLGDLDMWTFTASKGDNINLRVGTTNFEGRLQLFGPDGALLASAGGATDVNISNYAATNSGTFTVLVSSWFASDTGTYALHLAQFPEPFVVPPGDEGGPLTGSTSYMGKITLGDLDMRSFTACQGDFISLQLNTTNFSGDLELYGPTGVLLKSTGGSTALSMAYTATNCGTFTVLVSSWFEGGTGTYGLIVNGLDDELKVCPPIISGASLTVSGVGGPTNAVFVLYSSTNIAKPFGLWTQILTNRFDWFGVFNSTNVYNPALPQEYFRFVLP